NWLSVFRTGSIYDSRCCLHKILDTTKQTQQNTSDKGRVTQVTITDPQHPLFGRSFELLRDSSSRGHTFITIQLPNGQRRIVPRSATDLSEMSANAPTITLRPVSVRTLLPVVRFVKAKVATREEQYEYAPADRRDGLPTPRNPELPAERAMDAVTNCGTATTGAPLGPPDSADTTSKHPEG
ncbi:MAG: hypothetical protein P1S60_08180, partial [Anaerolineae bacterium]|nr:hypothetical protein [Anaerolineae bacterium]